MTSIICKCGAVELAIAENAKGNRATCYCHSCRGFAQSMGADHLLDEEGGVELFQTTPQQIEVVKGQDALAATRITEKGLYRWHCAKCNTPLTNSMDKSGFPFMGVVMPMDQRFPNRPELGKISTIYKAKDRPNPNDDKKDKGIAPMMWRIFKGFVGVKLSGTTGKSDWHDGSGNWIAQPNVMSEATRTKLYEKSKTL